MVLALAFSFSALVACLPFALSVVALRAECAICYGLSATFGVRLPHSILVRVFVSTRRRAEILHAVLFADETVSMCSRDAIVAIGGKKRETFERKRLVELLEKNMGGDDDDDGGGDDVRW